MLETDMNSQEEDEELLVYMTFKLMQERVKAASKT